MNISLIIPVILGLISGYLINFLADILPMDHRPTRPVCKNPDCREEKSWSNFFLLNRCPHCAKLPAWRHYLVLVAVIFFSTYLWLIPPEKMGFWIGFPVFLYLFLVALIDFETRLVLRVLSLAGLVICSLAGIFMRTWQETLLGAAAGFGIMLLFYLLGMLFSRIRNKRLGGSSDGEEALGSGDVTLATLLGLLLGWPMIWFNLLTGILLAGVFSLLLILGLFLTKKYRSMMVFIAYGPFFILSAFIMLYFPNLITAVISGG